MQPSVGAVEIGPRNLRRSSKFLPVLHEAIEAITSAEHQLANASQTIQHLPQRIDDARKQLAEKVRIEKLEEVRMQAQIARRIGVPPSPLRTERT